MDGKTIRGMLLAGTGAGLFVFVLFLLKSVLAAPLVVPPVDQTPVRDTAAELKLYSGGLANYREAMQVPVAGDTLTGIAALGGGGFAVLADASCVIFGNDGTLKKTIPLPAEAFCVAAGPGNSLYLGMPDHVEKLFLASGKIDEWTILGEDSIISSIAATNVLVFAADSGAKQIAVYDQDGRLLRMIRGTEDGPFHLPGIAFDLAIAPDNTLAVAEPGRQRVLFMDNEGMVLGRFGRSGTGISDFIGCCNPVQIACTADGSVVTFEKGVRRLSVYNENGELSSLVAGQAEFHESVSNPDIAVSSKNEILLLDPFRKMVWVFARKEARTE